MSISTNPLSTSLRGYILRRFHSLDRNSIVFKVLQQIAVIARNLQHSVGGGQCQPLHKNRWVFTAGHAPENRPLLFCVQSITAGRMRQEGINLKNGYCRFCGQALDHTLADLGLSPLANEYLKESDLSWGQILRKALLRLLVNLFRICQTPAHTPLRHRKSQ